MRDFVNKAKGGRVVQTLFLEAEQQDELRRLAKQEGLQVEFFGGLPLAERKLGIVFPEHVPGVSDPTKVLRMSFEGDLEALEDRLRAVIEPALMGDLEEVSGGFLLVTLPKGIKELSNTNLSFREPGPDELPKSRDKTRSVVVPSLRVDVVGAKGFGVSRNYFAQGVKAGKVKLKGKTASAKDEIAEGDSLLADGLGVITVKKVLGQTKRGNVKLEVEVHKG